MRSIGCFGFQTGKLTFQKKVTGQFKHSLNELLSEERLPLRASERVSRDPLPDLLQQTSQPLLYNKKKQVVQYLLFRLEIKLIFY